MIINNGYNFIIPKSNINAIKNNAVSFCKKQNKYTTVPCGTEYSALASSMTLRTKTIPELTKDVKDSKDISKDRDALICSRIKIAMKDAKAFKESHNQFDYDELCQELILFLIEATDKELCSGTTAPAATIYAKKRDIYFKNLLEADRRTDFLTKEDEKKLKAAEEETYFNQLEQKELQQSIDKELQTIRPREGAAIAIYYGLKGEEPKSYEETAKNFNVHREAIRLAVQSGIKRLRHPVHTQSLKIYY